MDSRIDWHMRQNVDAALAIVTSQGIAAAVRYMYSKGVPLYVARRLLLKMRSELRSDAL